MSTDATVHLGIGTDAKVLLRMSVDAQVCEQLLDFMIEAPEPLYDCPHHVVTCCGNLFDIGENNRSAVKGPPPPAPARSRLSTSPTHSRPLATNAPEKLTSGRPF